MNLPEAAVALNSIVTRESLFRARESEYVSFLVRSYWLFTDKRFARSKERSCRLDYIANFYERLYRTTDETTAIEKGKIRKGEGDRVREREREGWKSGREIPFVFQSRKRSINICIMQFRDRAGEKKSESKCKRKIEKGDERGRAQTQDTFLYLQ